MSASSALPHAPQACIETLEGIPLSLTANKLEKRAPSAIVFAWVPLWGSLQWLDGFGLKFSFAQIQTMARILHRRRIEGHGCIRREHRRGHQSIQIPN